MTSPEVEKLSADTRAILDRLEKRVEALEGATAEAATPSEISALRKVAVRANAIVAQARAVREMSSSPLPASGSMVLLGYAVDEWRRSRIVADDGDDGTEDPTGPRGPVATVTTRKLLDDALRALHAIGSAFYARRRLAEGSLRNEVLRRSIEEKALTDEGIEKLALDTFESIALDLHTRRDPST